MTDLHLFKWYDWIAILVFFNLFHIFLFATLFGGGIITAIILALLWEGWKIYEKWRIGYYDT